MKAIISLTQQMDRAMMRVTGQRMRMMKMIQRDSPARVSYDFFIIPVTEFYADASG